MITIVPQATKYSGWQIKLPCRVSSLWESSLCLHIAPRPHLRGYEMVLEDVKATSLPSFIFLPFPLLSHRHFAVCYLLRQPHSRHPQATKRPLALIMQADNHHENSANRRPQSNHTSISQLAPIGGAGGAGAQ